MMGRSHTVFGYLVGTSVAQAIGVPLYLAPVCGMAAGGCARGDVSPDMDRTGPWQAVSAALGHPRILAHRYLTHDPFLYLVLLYLNFNYVPKMYWAVTLSVIVGGISHVLADMPFGRVHLFCLIPIGWGFETGGRVERMLMRPLVAASAWVTIGHPGGNYVWVIITSLWNTIWTKWS